jgi:uridylate kinase
MFGEKTLDPGASAPMTEVAVTICQRSNMLIFVIGKEITVIKDAIDGKCSGTEIGQKK